MEARVVKETPHGPQFCVFAYLPQNGFETLTPTAVAKKSNEGQPVNYSVLLVK